MSERKCIGADGQIHKKVAAVGIRVLRAGEFRLVADERDCRIRHDGAGRVCNRACDAAECLLSVRIRCQHGCHREE